MKRVISKILFLMLFISVPQLCFALDSKLFPIPGDSAPAFDPISSFQLLSGGSSTYIDLGAYDNDNDDLQMTISADSGLTISRPTSTGNTGEYQTVTTYTTPLSKGRTNAKIGVKAALITGTRYLHIKVSDSRGAYSVIDLPVEIVNGLNNRPIVFGPVTHQTVKAGDTITIPFYVFDQDVSEALNLLVALPANATAQIDPQPTDFGGAYRSGKFIFTPSSSQIGQQEFRVEALDSRTTSSLRAFATFRVKVVADYPNSAPVFDPVSSIELLPEKTATINLGVYDSEDNMMTLTAEGPLVKSFTPVTGVGEINAKVTITAPKTPGLYFIHVNAIDDRRSNTSMDIPVYVFYGSVNKPILFNGISNQLITFGQRLEIPFYIASNDGNILNIRASLPSNAILKIDPDSGAKGYRSGKIIFTPAGNQNGLNDIHLYAYGSSAYKNVAQATLRVKVDPGAPRNMAPIFGPVSSLELKPGQVVKMNVSAYDDENNQITLSAQGQVLTSFTPAAPVAGYAEGVIKITAPSAIGRYFIHVTALDDKRSYSSMDIPVEVVSSTTVNKPSVFSAIELHQLFKVGQKLVLPFFVRDEDPETLLVKAALPTNAVLKLDSLESSSTGFQSGKIEFTPSLSQVGVQQIKLYASDGADRNLEAFATIEVHVDGAATSNSAPVFDGDVSAYELRQGEKRDITISAFDTEGDQVALTATSPLLEYTGGAVLPSPGRIEGHFGITAVNMPLGYYILRVNARDNRGSTSVMDIPIKVVSSYTNKKISFSSPVKAPVKLEVGEAYFFSLRLDNLDTETVTLSIVTPYDGVSRSKLLNGSVNSLTAILTPADPSAVGVQTLKYYASDAKGSEALVSQRIVVVPSNSSTRPIISEISPYVATVGSTLNIKGLKFTSDSKVIFANDLKTVTPNSWTATTINFTVPSGAKSGYVYITNSQGLSNEFYLTIF